MNKKWKLRILILGFISWNKSRSCFSFWMKLQFFKNSGFLLILVLSAGLLGFLGVFAWDFFGSSGNSPFRALTARSDTLSISAEKLNLFWPIERGERGARPKE